MTEFEKLVAYMRHNQKMYFRSKEQQFLEKCKELEKKVDQYLKEKQEEEKQPYFNGFL